MKWISGGLKSLISLLSQPVLATVVYDSMEGGGVWMSYKMWVIFQKKKLLFNMDYKIFQKILDPSPTNHCGFNQGCIFCGPDLL